MAVHLSTIEMTSKCSKLKWNHEHRASGFTVKFWSIKEQTMENCCRFVFYDNIDSFDVRYFSFVPSHEIPRAPEPNPQSSLTPKTHK